MKEIKGLLCFLKSGNLTEKEKTDAHRHLERMIHRNREEAQRDDKPCTSMLRDAVEKVEAQIPSE